MPDSLPLLCLALLSLHCAHTVPPENASAVATYRNLPLHIDARPSPTAVLAEDGNRYLVFLTNWSDLALRTVTDLNLISAGRAERSQSARHTGDVRGWRGIGMLAMTGGVVSLRPGETSKSSPTKIAAAGVSLTLTP